MRVSEAVEARQAIRAFLPNPVPGEVVRDLLDRAARAPSGGNLQPWKVHALTGEPLRAFTDGIAAKLDQGILTEGEAHQIYPPDLWEPYRSRRRAAGAQRYNALGLTREQNGQLELLRKNLRFFGAPVGLFFTIERKMGASQWTDLGLYMQTLMLLAVERGLATCPQEVWANWHESIAAFLRLPEDEMVFAGMSLGFADMESPMNGYRTHRAGLEEFATLQGF